MLSYIVCSNKFSDSEGKKESSSSDCRRTWYVRTCIAFLETKRKARELFLEVLSYIGCSNMYSVFENKKGKFEP